MREILFRGKRIDSELWVEGSLVNNIFFRAESNRPIPYIIDPHEYESYDCMEDIGELAVEVIEDTVGQFTGLHDKNGVEIFEGDIFTSDYFDDTYHFEVVFSDGAFCGKHKSTGIYMLGFTNFDDNGEDLGYWCEEDYTSHIQIIGNIHDNPKLLS